MINFNYITKENIKEHNLNWQQSPDYSYKMLIIGDSGSRKTNALFNPIGHQSDIDKIHLYGKDRYDAKYQFLINKREGAGLKYFNDSKAFIEYSNDMVDIYEVIEESSLEEDTKY